MDRYFDLVVIGKGIAGLSFLFELAKSDSGIKNKKIALFFQNDLFIPCSDNTTATVSLSRIEEGISPLGNLLSQSFYYFKNEVYALLLESGLNEVDIGVEKVTKKMYFISPEHKNKALLRFDDFIETTSDLYFRKDADSYLISEIKFQQVLLKFAQSYLNITVINEGIISIEPNTNPSEPEFFLKSLNSVYLANYLIDARGSYQRENAHFFGDLLSPRVVNDKALKSVRGSFLYKVLDIPFDESFYLVFDDVNLIYRKNSNELLIGSTSDHDSLNVPDVAVLKKKYEFICTHAYLYNLGILPTFNQFKMKTAIRTKAKKRTPVIYSVGHYKNYWAISGLYKNGYTTSFFLWRNFFHIHLKNQF